MGFYERITREQEPKLAAHSIMALLGEVERGQLTLGQAATALGLSVDEQAEALTLLGRLVPPREAISLGSFVTLTNIGTAYDGTDAGRGLGVALIQTAGITQVIFGVRVNKVGTGTQSWQLFNDTDGTEVAVIDDAGVAGVKTLSTTVNFSAPLAAGIKTIRVRAKSTTAADDPIFLGAALSIRRASVLTSIELHEVLLCADFAGAPYTSSVALKTRLGV